MRIVAYRFLKVFHDHGVKITQIQRLIPEATLDKVTDPMALLTALTNDVLNRTAELFGIQRAWLDGVDECMYPSRKAYQNPPVFFELFASLAPCSAGESLRAYCTAPALDYRDSRRQPIVIVFAEKIADWDDGNELIRFRPLTEEWYWDYPKSRLQLKAMLRALHDRISMVVVPLYRVSAKTLSELSAGKMVPPSVPHSHDVSLEDYVMTPQESKVSKESEELDAVMSLMNRMTIEALAKSTKVKNAISDQTARPPKGGMMAS